MKTPSRAVLALCAVLTGAASAPAVDFTLRHGTVFADGLDIQSTYVVDGNSKIFLHLQPNWKVTDGPAGLDILPEFTGSKIRIENVGGTRALALDETGKAALRKQVESEIPGGAKNVTALPDQDDPLPIFGWKDTEITRSYEFYGQTIYQSSMYLNMVPGRVVRVSITANKEDYNQVHDAVRRLLFSWVDVPKDATMAVPAKNVGS